MRFFYFTIIATLTLLTSCFIGPSGNDNRSNTVGVINIAVDETLQPFIAAEIAVFISDYPKAVIRPQYVAGQRAISNLMKDTAAVAIVARKLTDKEMEMFYKAYNYRPNTHKIAEDAVALIINKKNSSILLSIKEVKAIFNGTITQWQQLDSSNLNGDIKIVFDNPYSSTVLAIKQFAGIKKMNAANMKALNSNEKTIQYVSRHSNTLGVIGVNWISHKQSKKAQAFQSQIQVIAISQSKNKAKKNKYYKPLPENIKLGLYPIVRDIYAINAGASISLGTGFVSFLNSQRGQLIIKRGGLVPARPSARLINIKSKL